MEDATDMCSDLNFREGNEIEFSIVPNPGIDMIEIQIQRTKTPIREINISDMNGKTVLNSKLEVYQGENYIIDINSLSNGVYFLNLRSKNSIKTEKLVVSK